MRIIAGRFKRRTLASPSGDAIRPTTDRTRESMFNVIGARLDLEGAVVADLFCGSGSLGLEAFSRGASRVEFVDRETTSLALARKNAFSLDEHAPCRFIRSDAKAWARQQTPEAYDLILADPPYHADGIETLIDVILPLLRNGGLFLLEHDRSLKLPEHVALEAIRTYGKTAVAIYHKTFSDVDA
ncbi:MAG: 16S rRNA (guanine(966)-N(2))-methyltransferase RsmD [Rhodothermales bacterium]